MAENDRAVNAAADVARIAAATVRLPAFWDSRPRAWFGQAEAEFEAAGITRSRTKFNRCLVALPQDIVDTVLDILEDDVEPDPYTKLRDRLVGTYTPGVWQQADMLLDSPSLGDRKPSQMMSSMLALMDKGDKPGVLFFALFRRRLPPVIQQQLGGQKWDDARALATRADELWDAAGRPCTTAVTAVTTERARTPSPHKGKKFQRGRSKGGRKGNRSATPANSELCFYHENFGKKARQCQEPCSWSEN